MQGIYIHIPFCHRKCGYCDFNSYAGLDALVAPFVEALHREIEQSPYAGAHFDTVFFGGGTPTYLDGATLAGILEHLARRFAIPSDTEITCEANPGSVSLEQLRTLRQAGFNRLSFGVQSFHPDELRRMERIHTPEEVVQSVAWARAAGFTNMNLDLIFALPQQTLERWEGKPTASHRPAARTPVAVRANAGAEHAFLSPVPEGQTAPARRRDAGRYVPPRTTAHCTSGLPAVRDLQLCAAWLRVPT
jgi:hypothetical protein